TATNARINKKFNCLLKKRLLTTMPPKTNDKKKGDKSPQKNTSPEKQKKTESENRFLQARIQDLDERLQRYQHKCDKLEIEAKVLHTKIDTVEKEKTDMVLYLKNKLEKKENDLADLKETLSKHQQAQKAEQDSFQMQLNRCRLQLKETIDKLTFENMALATKLASLKEFSAQKEMFMYEYKALKEKLQKEKEEHQEKIYSLEKKALLHNDRLHKEMLENVAAAAKKLSQKVPETAVLAMQENLSFRVQFKHLSDRIEELLEENNALKVKEKQLKIKYKTMEPVVQEITRKNVTDQKVIRNLTEKCKQMKSELEKYNKLQTAHQRLLGKNTIVITELDVLRQNHAILTEELQQTKAEVEKHRRDLEKERRLGEQLKRVLHETATALKEALREVPKNDHSEVQATGQRNHLMQMLLTVLETSAAVGVGPALADFMPTTGQQPTTSSNLAHFKTRDLKLVPRKTDTASVKTRHLSKGVHTTLHK
ncbi:MAG: hypothetical protein ACRDDA_08750, partial [Aeromonas sp.]